MRILAQMSGLVRLTHAARDWCKALAGRDNSGSVREEYTYVRHGNAVWVRRVVDTALERGGHAQAADLS